MMRPHPSNSTPLEKHELQVAEEPTDLADVPLDHLVGQYETRTAAVGDVRCAAS